MVRRAIIIERVSKWENIKFVGTHIESVRNFEGYKTIPTMKLNMHTIAIATLICLTVYVLFLTIASYLSKAVNTIHNILQSIGALKKKGDIAHAIHP